MDTTKTLFNLFAGMFDYLDRWSVASLNRQAAMHTIRTITDVSQKTVLDIGCGTGAWSAMFASAGAVVSGIDFAENMITIARRHYPALSFCVSDAHHLNTYSDNSVDIVTASFVLHDIGSSERKSVLQHMHRIAKAWVFLFDYGDQKIPLLPRIFEWFEGNRYKAFVPEIDEELDVIFQTHQTYHLQHGGALYACRCSL